MKRFLSIMMASVLMVLTLSTALTAMAESDLPDDLYVSAYYTYEEETTTLTPDYQVDIDMPGDFTYNYKRVYKQEWDNTNNRIKTVVDESASGWTTPAAEIKITNNSNVGITAGVLYMSLRDYNFAKIEHDGNEDTWLDANGGKMTISLKLTGAPSSGSSEATKFGQIEIYIGGANV